jgi:uncharacterized protein DUF5995
MEAILSPLAPADGIACFTRLYLAVTRGVQERVDGVAFQDPAFLARLDVHFADLFFAAVERPTHAPAPPKAARSSGRAPAASPPPLPAAWAPLFEARSQKGIAPLQFAFAGMNAHINRDLPVALVATCEEAGISLEEGTPQHGDYVRLNTVLAQVERDVKAQYLTGWLRRLDRLVHRIHRIDDVVAMWDVARARDAAWVNAEALWALRGERALSEAWLDTLDRSVGLAGRGLLIPADTWLQKLGRKGARGRVTST